MSLSNARGADWRLSQQWAKAGEIANCKMAKAFQRETLEGFCVCFERLAIGQKSA